MIAKEEALRILKDNIKNKNLRKHHYAVAAAMRALAEAYDGNPEQWEIVGLLHDADYEKTKEDPNQHGTVMAETLAERGVRDDIVRAIEAHNYEHTDVMPKSSMEWALVTCDDLTGLIVAVALVHPTKLAGVSVESVMKKFDAKSFAAGADRARIRLCETKLDIPLEDFVALVLEAMKGEKKALGL